MRVTLSPAFIASAKAEPGAERTIFWDDTLAGFGLQVTSAGHKSFVCQYRANRKSKRFAIKATLKLGEARKEARAAIGAVAKGRDPLAERRKAEGAAANTLGAITAEYFKRESRNLRTFKDRQAALARLVLPKFGSRQIAEIKRSEIVRMLDRIEDENGAVMADRTLSYLRRVMNWHASRSDDFNPPFARGMARSNSTERARQRTLSDAEIKKIWTATGKMNNAYGPLVRFILLTATRKTEAARMQRSEVSGSVWTLPAARNKTKRDHVIPLSKGALAVLTSMPVVGHKWMFSNNGEKPVRGFCAGKEKLDQLSGVSDWTIHDLRRTSRTLMSRVKVESDIAERCLGHVIRGIRGTYDRFDYFEEKRAAFEALAKEVERII